MTYAGHAYFQERQNNPRFSPDEQDLTRRIVRQQGDRLTDPFRPKDPMVDGLKDGETHVAFAKRRLAHQKNQKRGRRFSRSMPLISENQRRWTMSALWRCSGPTRESVRKLIGL